jgi:hypothetical protein
VFIGHFGLALAAKKAAPRTSLGTLILAAQFLDLLWPIFLLLGVEHVEIAPGITKVTPMNFTDYPISHSLLMVLVWSSVVGGIYYALRGNRRAGWVVALLVLGHWVLDLIVHRPDLPWWPGSGPKVGFGLWNSWAGSVLAEVVIFGAGAWIYLHSTRARDRTGRYALWSLLVFLCAGWLASLFAGAPNVTALAWGAMTMWLMVPWGWWADKHREPAGASNS